MSYLLFLAIFYTSQYYKDITDSHYEGIPPQNFGPFRFVTTLIQVKLAIYTIVRSVLQVATESYINFRWNYYFQSFTNLQFIILAFK